jgi:hypothetical protein
MTILLPDRANCSRRDLDMRATAITDAGFMLGKDSSYVAEFTAGLVRIYLKKTTKAVSIVLPPGLEKAATVAAAANSGKVATNFYHNSGMDSFPKRLNRGAEPEHFGVAVTFGTLGAMMGFLRDLADTR